MGNQNVPFFTNVTFSLCGFANSLLDFYRYTLHHRHSNRPPPKGAMGGDYSGPSAAPPKEDGGWD